MFPNRSHLELVLSSMLAIRSPRAICCHPNVGEFLLKSCLSLFLFQSSLDVPGCEERDDTKGEMCQKRGEIQLAAETVYKSKKPIM